LTVWADVDDQTDSFYTAMFLTVTDAVVLVDAPPTIGHNLRAGDYDPAQ
jgi:hypothetical protein